MPLPGLDAAGALTLGERLAGVAVLIGSLELLARRRSLDRGGLLSWEVARLRAAWLTHGRLAGLLDLGFHGPGLVALIAARAAAALWLVAGPAGGAYAAAVIIAALASLLLMLRTSYGNDGADQMSLLVLVAGAIVHLSGSRPAVLQSALWFIALQACLSYATSGLSKLAGASWRDGSGIVGILSTHTYGLPPLARLLSRRRALAVGLSWMIIATETLFPLALVAPVSWLPFFLAGGLAFHLACAVVMGLNTFVWAFAAAYPAIYWVAVH